MVKKRVQVLDENGEPVLDDEGNPTYEEIEVDEDDIDLNDEQKAWHEEQVRGLKSANARVIDRKKKADQKNEKLQAELDEVKGQLEALKSTLGDDTHDIGNRLKKLKDFEAGLLENSEVDEDEILARGRSGAERKLQPQIEALQEKVNKLEKEKGSLQGEVLKFKYTGRLKSTLGGIIKPGYEVAALATIRDMTRYDEEEDDIIVTDIDGEQAYDTEGHPQSVEEYMEKIFPKRFPDMCIKVDESLSTNGPKGRTKTKEKNPFSKEDRNVTHQMQMVKNDPAKARKLMREAGVDPATFNL